jgi:phospholipid:diacylglycerol acyltransferase
MQYIFSLAQDSDRGDNIAHSNGSCGDTWTEYHEMGWRGIKAVADYKVYTMGSIVDLLSFVAPKMMQRGSAHFSYGIADNLDDPKYQHYKYWSNPLETKYVFFPLFNLPLSSSLGGWMITRHIS